MSDIGRLLQSYVERAIPNMGSFILKKQCDDLGLDLADVPEERLEELAERLSDASEMFLGYEKSQKLKWEIIRKEFLK